MFEDFFMSYTFSLREEVILFSFVLSVLLFVVILRLNHFYLLLRESHISLAYSGGFVSPLALEVIFFFPLVIGILSPFVPFWKGLVILFFFFLFAVLSAEAKPYLLFFFPFLLASHEAADVVFAHDTTVTLAFLLAWAIGILLFLLLISDVFQFPIKRGFLFFLFGDQHVLVDELRDGSSERHAVH